MADTRQQLAKRLMTAAVGVPAAIIFSLVGGWGFLLEPILLGLLVAPSAAGFLSERSALGTCRFSVGSR